MPRGVLYYSTLRFLQFFLVTKSTILYLITRNLHLSAICIQFSDISEEKNGIYFIFKRSFPHIKPSINKFLTQIAVILNVLCRFIGPRPAMFLGCTIFSVGTALTYFTLEQASESIIVSSNQSINF